MKNLKRVLSLALALVMVLGMLTVAGAADEAKKTAKDLSDYDTIVNKEAVALLYDLGIINGMPDGTFTPNGNVDRSSWAKMVYYVKEGNTSPEMYKGTANTLKDIAGWWAEGEIAYLYSAGIVSGDDLGNFNIRANIRVDEAAKTLLTSLGYDSKDRGYEGSPVWSANIIKDARGKALLEGIDQAANESLTRENAARMIFNALFANVETPSYGRDNGEQYVTGYTTGATLGKVVYNLEKKTGTVTALDADGNATIGGVKAPATADVIGENGVVYTWGKDNVSSFVITAGSSVLKTYTDGSMDLKKAIDKADKKNFVAEADGSISLYVDGVLQSGPVTTGTTIATNVLGNVVSLLDNDGNGKIDTIKVTTWTLATLTADPTTRTKDGVLQVKVGGVTNWVDASKVTGYADLKKGDVVLSNVSNGLYTIEKAEIVAGNITAKTKAGDLTVAGKTLSAGTISGTEATDFAALKTGDTEYNFYLDKNGTVAKFEQTSEDAAEGSTVVLLDNAWVGPTGGLNGTKGYFEAAILLEDATTQTIKVTTVAEEDVASNTSLSNGKFYTATEDKDGNWDLTIVDEAKSVADKSVSANPKFDATNSANNKTVFIVGVRPEADKAPETYTKYTGYATLPGLEGADIEILEDKGVATLVFIVADSVVGEVNEDYIYVTSADWTMTGGNYVYPAVDMEGDEITLTTKTALIEQPGLYTVTKADAEGVVTAVKEEKLTGKIDSCSGGVLTLTDSKYYSYDSKTAVIVIDIDDEGAVTVTSGLSLDDLDVSVRSTDAEGTETGTYGSVSVKVVSTGEGKGELADTVYVLRDMTASVPST